MTHQAHETLVLGITYGIVALMWATLPVRCPVVREKRPQRRPRERSMRVRVLFLPSDSADEMPTIIDVCDEYTEDAWGGTPDFYAESMRSHTDAREMVVIIPDHAILKVFTAPVVTALIDGDRA